MSRDLRQVCEDPEVAERRLGEQVARALRSRLADLRAVDSIIDLPVGQPVFLGLWHNRVRVEISDGCSILFEENHVRVRSLPDGRVDWARVRRIKILAVGEVCGHD